MGMEISQNEILQFAIENGMLDIHKIEESYNMNRREEILKKHNYKIFQGKDGRWKTTVPDNTKKNGRRMIAKASEDDLYAELMAYYSSEKEPINKNVTLEGIYPEWLKSRVLEVNSIRTVKKNDQDWKRYYKDTEITKIPMRYLTVNQLKNWAHKLIDEKQFNKRDYYNMIVIMKKCFEYASDDGVCDNTWSKVKINSKKLKRNEKKSNETQIYFYDEKITLTKYCISNFLEHPWKITSLAIPLLFITGLRIGEVAALKYSDLSESYIHVSSTEVASYEFDKDNGKFIYKGKQVESHAKTDAGERDIPYTDGAKKIVEMIKSASEMYNYFDNNYIFCPSSKRICSTSIDNNLYRYCEKLGIPKKSAHKIRKTYISQILNSGMDLDTVCRVSGHVDLKTTLESYLFCLERKDDIYNKFNTMFSEVSTSVNK